VPFLDIRAVANFLSGLGLYFKVFEYNASIYYLARWLGYLLKGYDTIAVTGTLLAIISLCVILAIAWREKQTSWESLLSSMLVCLSAYLLLATTVHPWYLTTLVALSALTKYRYAVAWSFLAVLSYSAYQSTPYNENLWLVAAEYILLAAFAAYEVFLKKNDRASNSRPEMV
jgi:alpha-1,6-mannosyltransferase